MNRRHYSQTANYLSSKLIQPLHERRVKDRYMLQHPLQEETFLRKGYAYDYYQDKVMKSQSVFETFLHYTNLNVPYVIQWMES